ncbi:MAG: N-acetylmuramoyl-L-alanine amidase [Candidatus Riflebacteria bacterium]|nr:N-acetylmuramoyl-L-alanine amidase [Candidatus Riflebacteria bacterium]
MNRTLRRTVAWCCLLLALINTPTPADAAPPPATKPLKGFSILLDPGHGGADSGAVGPTGLKESTANLRVATYLRMLLLADGASVTMTREGDQFLSLGDRVAIASRTNPDLFVSIHHNASLNKNVVNRAEVFYNGLDQGMSWLVGQAMVEGFKPRKGDMPTLLIPGGFFVLRNCPVPGVLTEAGYISLKPIERELKSAKGLTAEAQILRMAIRKAFSQPRLEAEVFTTRPAFVNTAFTRFIVSTSEPIAQARFRVTPPSRTEFAIERIPFGGTVYALYNTRPLPSGDYEVSMLFTGLKGSVSRTVKLPIRLELPPEGSVLMPVAPNIPAGLQGEFPLVLVLKDAFGRVNPRQMPFTARWGDRVIPGITGPDGKAVILLQLTGQETGPQAVEVNAEERVIARTAVEVAAPRGNLVIGQVFSGTSRTGLEKVRIQTSASRMVQTTAGGYFACEFPVIFRNLRLRLIPPAGYLPEERWIRMGTESVARPRFVFEPYAPRLQGRSIGIIAGRDLDPWVRPLVKGLMKCGVKVFRLPFPAGQEHPEYVAVTRANAMGTLDAVLSLKAETGPTLVMRHYHRGGAGKAIAEAVKKQLSADPAPVSAAVAAGSDYELGNTGATCLVVGIPALVPPQTNERVAEAFLNALQQQF